METTTVKLHRDTKLALDDLRSERESYDEVIGKLITHRKNKDLKKELMQGYKSMGKTDLAILEEWETSSQDFE